MGEQLLDGLGVPFDELLARSLESFEYPVEIVHSSHLGLTSTVDTSSFPKGRSTRILRYSPDCVEGEFSEVHLQDRA